MRQTSSVEFCIVTYHGQMSGSGPGPAKDNKDDRLRIEPILPQVYLKSQISDI